MLVNLLYLFMFHRSFFGVFVLGCLFSVSWGLNLPFQKPNSFSRSISNDASNRADVMTSPQSSLSRVMDRRTLMQSSILTMILSPMVTFAEDDPRMITTIRLQAGDSLGLQIVDSVLRGKPIVVVQQVVRPNKNNQKIREGMVLQGYDSSLQVTQRIKNGPYPIDLEFLNLAAGGDAFDDLGGTMVTPKDALNLARQTDSPPSNNLAQGNAAPPSFSITTTQKVSSPCAIRSRRGDVLELIYEAFYVDADGTTKLYDASDFRGTGRPYQVVLGSGDMIPGVDQGLYDMCPGEGRQLQIPPVLAYGKRARDSFRIPPTYQSLQWKVKLFSIDSTIREDNNDVSRDDRESRFMY
ncbi:unnamed protein product [Cylindrotheca closterium]|uniref:peptidylprolyl isomerase n=1 Tax=Cylindrotheca closterium TaxID=2856 RepID=A0AAD2G0S3_9STRA|nr:unnamed protein product [Cylindrotheca closterium]